MPAGSCTKRLWSAWAAEVRRETYEGVLVDRKTGGDVLTKANIRRRDAFGCRDEAGAIDCG